MKLSDLSIETWTELRAPDKESGGYPGISLTLNESDPSILHLFKDHSGYHHFAIEISAVKPIDLNDIEVNGLLIQEADYQFFEGLTKHFIDLTCNFSSYLEEFTEVVREISVLILSENLPPIDAVNTVIRNWLTFWGKPRKDVLSEDQQVGLICELLVLRELCAMDPERALQSWRGPLKEKFDFSFVRWDLEVKGTSRSSRIHTINGIEQLSPSIGKRLGFVSFQVRPSSGENSLHLPNLIASIRNTYFSDRPDLQLKFAEKLFSAGYYSLYATAYQEFKVQIQSAYFHEITDDFPKLIPDMLKEPLSFRVSKIRYEIDMNGWEGIALDKVKWAELLS